ncbi:epimerase [Tenacibaculum holothuriorum]|uniref:Epimerase n=1 Tax=Tenacibaculum holothuriorum TaxID=1635173 RepID=A0A1Y2PDH7_9FLAO|nr:SDR family oxidoreductase [Tenacibaculum holothuriorum]OSY87789.1 epimerase [Tenacibaculum holothuriorum]
MKVLITGITGYVGKRLVPLLLKEGHTLVCCIRDLRRIPSELKNNKSISFVELDFLKPNSKLPNDIDIAYYLIHSMSTSSNDFESLEEKCAKNFKKLISTTSCQQVIYLSGIVNDNSLSKHLQSRYKVEQILQSDNYYTTTFRAGIIVGSGSASFEIIRDLVEKLPVMITPKWLHTKTQPIAIRDVLNYLTKAIANEKVYNKSFDIYGPEVLTYKDMLLQFAEVRGLKRYIFTLPILTPKLSSYWLYFVTSTSFNLAKSLVDSMTVEVIGKENKINDIIKATPITYKESVNKAFVKIAQNSIVSSWKDAKISGVLKKEYKDYINLPHFGCFKDIRSRKMMNEEETIDKVWSIGGKKGWYKFDFLWEVRGIVDQFFGGVGLRRGRRHPTELKPGDALDFWRVLLADKKNKRLLLFAEMKLPGEAWLEFKIVKNKLYQRAVFRPKGIFGRMYWYAVLPFHAFVFKGMINRLVEK